MIKNIFSFIALVFIVSCATRTVKHSVEYPTPQEKKLSNGLTILYLQDKKLPLVSVSLMLKSGSVVDPKGKEGLTAVTAELLEKGTSSKNADELADQLAHLGTSFRSDVDQDLIMLSTEGLSHTQAELFKIFAEIVMEPKFSESEFLKTKKQLLAIIKESYDQPRQIADLSFSKTLMASYPYGRDKYGSLKSISSLQAKDIAPHYKKYFRPNNAILAVTGDISDASRTLLENQFAAWPSQDVPTLMPPKFPELKGVNYQLVHREDLKQSEVRMGHQGIQRNHPDFVALRLASTVLGGNFSSRLMTEIRVRRGLAYGIQARFDTNLWPGPFWISTGTRHDKVGEVVHETLKLLKEFRDGGITQAELDEAKAYLKGKFVQGLETPEAVTSNILRLRLNGIPDSFLREYLSELEGLTLKQVNAAIKRHFNPENIQVTVYSKKDEALPQLKLFGPVSVRSYKDFL